MPRTRSLRPSNPALRTALGHRHLIGLNKRLLAVVTVFSILAGLVQAGLLLVIARAGAGLTGDAAFINGPLGPFGDVELSTAELLWAGFALVVVLVIAEVTVSWSQATLQAKAQQRVRTHMHHVFARSPFAAQSARARGDQSYLLNGITSEASLVSAHFSNGLVATANFVTLTVSAFLLSPLATVTVSGGLIVMLAVLRPLLRIGRTSGDEHMRAARRLSTRVTERLETILEVKSYGADDAATRSILDRVDEVALRVRQLRFVSRMSSVAYRVGALALVLGMLAVITSAGATNFAALTGALLMLMRSLSYGQGAQAAYQQINETLPAVEQLVAEEKRLVESIDEIRGYETPESLAPIVLDGVDFSYPGADKPVLRDIGFTVEPGAFVAIVGPSGSGKSTLMSLLLRLRRPTEGTIGIGHHSLDTVEPGWWHERVAYVPQVSKLTSGTVADAIRFGRDLSDTEVHEAAKLAHIADEIEMWPDGYQTEVGQLGDQLSGGQRQRVALARALAGRPQLLLLDEPTSSLDPTSERLIADSLELIREDTTIVTIAHRLATVETADVVIHLRDGQMVTPRGNTRDELELALSA